MPGKIHVPVTVATDGFTKLQRTFSRLRGMTIGLTAALGGLGAAAKAIDFTGSAIQGARDLERNYAGLESVFKGSTQQMKDFGASASEMGLSMNEAAKATTFIGSVLKQSGFSISETADLTEELVTLGADLALTYGYDVQEALLGMTALFRGEYDPIEKFGVAMKQSEIDAEKAARGLDGLTGAAERFADQQIRVEFLMERAGDAIGAFERQAGNLTVQQMQLRAEFENIRDTVGAGLLPILADLTGEMRVIIDDAAPRVKNSFENLEPVLETLGDQIMPMLEGAINGIIDAFDIVVGIIAEAQDPTTELGDSMENLGKAIGRLFDSIEEDGPSAQEIINGVAEALEFLADSITVVVDTIDKHGEGILTFLGIVLAARMGKGAAGALGKKNANVQTLEGIATNIALIGAAIVALPKGLIAVGIIGFLLGNAIYKDTQYASELQALADDLETIDYNIQGIESSFSGSSIIRMNPYGAIRDMANEAAISQEGLNSAFEGGYLGLNNLDGAAENADTALQKVGDTRFDGALADSFNFLDSLGLITDEARRLELQLDLAFRQRIAQASAVSPGFDPDFKAKTPEIIDPGDPGPVATDYVAEFFDGIKEGIEKEAARLDLEELGLSQALIDQILGSQGWEELFQTIIKGGEEMARQLQDDFAKTAAGIKETQEAAEALAEANQKIADEIADLNRQMADAQAEYNNAVKEATDAFADFKKALDVNVDALQTYDREIGRFESQTRSDLSRIESQIMDAFDNGYLLEEAKNNLLEYARAELNVLIQIQKQRDLLLARRNAAADVIFGIAEATTAAGNLTTLLRDVQDEITEVQVTELFEDVVRSADGLKDFKVTVERNYTDVIETTVNKSRQLVNGFQDVVNRTREFIDNLKILRELGLDPFLFNQLVEAGAEAGGATAQALVEGGKDTVMEVNSLQRELESLGVELGEQTYEVTKNSGAQFVSGIVDGMDDELSELQQAAKSIAENFGQTFAEAMNSAMENAFDGILEGIKSEFAALMSELQALLDELRNMQTNVYPIYEGQKPSMPTITGDTPTAPRIPMPTFVGPEITPPPSFTPPGPAPDPFSGYRTSGGGGGITIMNVTANNPLDAYNASKGNVLQQSTFQSANGSIEGTLSGVGS